MNGTEGEPEFLECVGDAGKGFRLGAGAEVTVRRGQLTVWTLSPIPALYRGLRLHPDDPDNPSVFRVDLSQCGLGTARIVLSRDVAGQRTGLHFEGILLSAEKSPAKVTPGCGRVEWLVGWLRRPVKAVRDRVTGGTAGGGHERYNGRGPLAYERHRSWPRRSEPGRHPVGKLSRLIYGGSSGQPVDQPRLSSSWPSRRSKRRRTRIVRSPQGLICLRSAALFTIKENIDVAGTPTTQGFKALANA